MATDGDLNLLSKDILKEDQKAGMLEFQSKMNQLTRDLQEAGSKAAIIRGMGEETKARVEGQMNKEEREVMRMAEKGAVKGGAGSGQPKRSLLAAPNKGVGLQGQELKEKVNQVAAKMAQI